MTHRDLIKYLMPKLFIDCVMLGFNILNNFSFKKTTLNNKKWENVYKDESVFVIGNGPSLLNIDINLLKGKKVIVMNSFEKATWKNEVDIVAHCIGEPYGLKSWIESNLLDSIHGTNSKSYWLHLSSKDKLSVPNKGDLIHYVFPLFEPNLWQKKKITLHTSTLGYQTTAQLAIQVALYMGFKDIALLGFDHDWLASPQYSKHFYSSKKDDADTLVEMTYLEIVNLIQRMWLIYYALKGCASAHKARIYNLSNPTFLDVFEKKTIQNF